MSSRRPAGATAKRRPVHPVLFLFAGALMSRPLAFAGLALFAASFAPAQPPAATPAPAAPAAPAGRAAAAPEAAPELLLSPTAQLYVRWDGVAAHNEAYKKSVWGPVMAGPTGDSIRSALAKVTQLLGGALLAEPLLDGKPPAELKANL